MVWANIASIQRRPMPSRTIYVGCDVESSKSFNLNLNLNFISTTKALLNCNPPRNCNEFLKDIKNPAPADSGTHRFEAISHGIGLCW